MTLMDQMQNAVDHYTGSYVSSSMMPSTEENEPVELRVLFEKGIPGFPRSKKFILRQHPNCALKAYILLETNDDPKLSFLTLPLDIKTPLIQEKDLMAAAHMLNFDPENVLFLLMVSCRKEESGLEISVNLRAPILIDLENHKGQQAILNSKDYALRHIING